MNNDRHGPLRDDVRLLGEMLGETLRGQVGESLFAEMAVGAANTAASRTTMDGIEGIRAFVEKRSPNFRG